MLSLSISFIRTKTTAKPTVAIVLGSGLGDFAESLSSKVIIPTEAIPHYPVSTVEGHKGRLVFGKIGKLNLLAFQGRVHYYETGNLHTILYPIRVAHALGIKKLIVTNAAGGINSNFNPGDLMLISDHINLTFENPLNGVDTASRKRNVPQYAPEMQTLLSEIARTHNIPLQHGVYAGVKGPSYETSAEIKMLRSYGADAVGMSTVNEVSLASALGIKVAGISCITNFAAGIKDLKLSHAEVTEVANMAKTKFTELLREAVKKLS
ncbi:MAG: purine-nucleoside phosphorylase [Bacteroidetes bacterium]|nr:MAG: purine-nucleoside phosphorylase [Bacteroidota bacterium]